MTVYLDTNVVVDYVERNAAWAAMVASKLHRAVNGGDRLAFSDAVRFECLIDPMRKNNARLLAEYAQFFGDPALRNLPISTMVWDRAAAIRASHGFQPLDSIHLAAVVEYNCGLFLTADARLAKFTGLPVEVIS